MMRNYNTQKQLQIDNITITYSNTYKVDSHSMFLMRGRLYSSCVRTSDGEAEGC